MIGRILGFAVAAAITFASSLAHADEGRAALDWGKVLLDLHQMAKGQAESAGSSADAGDVRSTQHAQPLPGNLGNAWFGVTPRVAVVARDWGAAHHILGDRVPLVDAMRLSASTRMVVGRLRFADARITPFLQLGLGQWRTDPNHHPRMPRNIELAGQIGGGVEISILPNWKVACETSMTAIVRDHREPQNLPDTRLWSAMAASRIEF